jgi:hypothetical protein
MNDFCHNIEPFLQINPSRNPGGDCFACALTAVLRHLYPEKNVDFNKVWEYFLTKQTSDGKPHLSNTWPGMYDAIIEAIRDENYDFKLEYRREYVYPRIDIESWSHCFGIEQSPEECGYRLEAWLKAGWIALAEIQYTPTGKHGWQPDGYRQSNDHFILIDGIRMGWWWEKYTVNGKECESGSLRVDVHVVCSAKGKYWIDYKELLEAHGVGAWLLVRKDLKERMN